MVAGSFLLGVTSASPDLFLSSSATDALDRSIRESTRYGAGLTIALHDARYDELAGRDERVDTAAVRARVLSRAAAPIPHLDDRILSTLSDPVPVSSTRAETADANPVRLVYRTGALDHIRPVAGEGTGAWVQDVTADALKIEPGDEIVLHGSSDLRARVRVSGIYEALADSPPDPFWEPLADQFRPASLDAPLPPPFVLLGREEAAELSDRIGHDQADFQWEAPIEPGASLDLGAASELADDFTAFGATLLDTRSPVGRYFSCTTCQVPTPIRVDVRSTLERDVQQARETADSLRPSIELLAAAGLLSALVVLGAAGLYAVNRRRTEMRLLIARGVAPATVAAKTALECLLPVVVGAAAGVAVSTILLERFGPGDKLDRASLVDAVRVTAAMIPVALLVIAAVAGLSTMRFSARAAASRRPGWALWEIPALVLAGLALRQALDAEGLITDPSGSVGRVSPWLLVFPVLFVGAGGGVAARAFRRLLVALRAPRLRVAPSLYLALNRLATAGGLAVMLITASALAFGIFLYAQTMSASVRATTTAKSYVFTGSDVAVAVDRRYAAPPSFEWPNTTVTSKLDAGRIRPSNASVDILAVDLATFERAAYWDESFSDRSLAQLLESLDRPSDQPLPVVVAGELPARSAFEVGGVSVPYNVTARVNAFPGQFLDRTLFVVNRATAGEAIEAAGALNPITTGAAGSLWIRGDAEGILASLGELGFAPDDALTASIVLQNPSFVAVARTFAFLEALGALAAMLVLVGIVLYVQTRQRGRTVSYALARRMGLRARSHYSALVMELGAMLGLSLVAGCALGGLAARLVYARVDLLPNIPPNPLLRIPFDAALPVAAGLVVAAVAGALLAHRSAERADVTEALRSGV